MPVSIPNSYPRIVLLAPSLAKQSQYFLMIDVMVALVEVSREEARCRSFDNSVEWWEALKCRMSDLAGGVDWWLG